MDVKDTLVFFVNGKKVQIKEPDPEITLLQYLRRTLYLTGTKEACGQGACGACTVMVSTYDIVQKKIRNISVNACLVPICYLHGVAVTTVEGLGSSRGGLHPIQKSLVESHGLQCGFCTPGMVMTMYTLFRSNSDPTQEQMERVLEGNLCRCTGYRPIVDAFRSAKEKCPCGLGFCEDKAVDTPSSQQTSAEANQQDVIFPSELQLNASYHTKSVTFKTEKYVWHRPSCLVEVFNLQKESPDAFLVTGCNTVGYLLRKGQLPSNVIICCTHVKELQRVQISESDIRVGAAVTLGRLEYELKKTDGNKTIKALMDVLRWVGVDQIRNTATIGGHIMSQAPNLDVQVFLVAAGADMEFMTGNQGTSVVKMNNTFFEDVNKGEYRSKILVSIRIPTISENEHILGVKQPTRRGFDYGIVTAGMYVEFHPGKNVVQNMRLAFGGVSNKPVLTIKAPAIALNKSWDENLMEKICSNLTKELENAEYEDINFRITLACSLFLKFFLHIKYQLEKNSNENIMGLSHTPTSGIQTYDVTEAGSENIVWKPIPNVTSEYIVAGEAEFIDDKPCSQTELFAGLVTSAHAHAEILSVDVSKAMALDGVVEYIDHKDIPSHNKYGVFVEDQHLFSEDEVYHHGQVIGAVLAESRKIAMEAVRLVKVEYRLKEVVVSMDDAIRKEDFMLSPNVVVKGNIDDVIKEADHVIEGECETGAQEHMYMEPQSAFVVPRMEQNELDVFTSSQDITAVQENVSKFLNIDSNRVNTRVKRVGGGFGGKIVDSVPCAAIASVGAWKTKRPVRCIFDRETDIRLTGKRHPVKAIYKVYFNKDGRILGLDVKYFFDAGYASGFSPLVMRVGMTAIQSTYDIKNLKVEGKLCKTNTPSNTAFRGMGVPQVVFVMECMVQKVASFLRLSAEKVRSVNLLRKGGVTAFHMPISDDNLFRCWEECKQDADFDKRMSDVLTFNGNNRWRKRGMAMVPGMFPIGYPPLFLNQAGALVNVYKDGSVLLSHAGVELGQGLHTKMIQVAASVLEIPHRQIIIAETASSSVPNTTETGGSNTADLNAGAVQDACKKIKERLQPFREQNPDGNWNDWVKAAYFSRVSLSATGFYRVRDVGFDFEKHTGVQAHYFTYGVSCTEVEIDCLTGEHQVIRTDIVMDVGKSLNPAIDVGQIEGGYVQGYGMMTMEQLKIDKNGHILSEGPLSYKVPGVRNIPRQMNVKLLKGGERVKTVYSAKGIGEPPFILAVSAFFAIKEAVLAARREENLTDDYFCKCPATVERIRMACQDKITESIHVSKET